MTANMILGAALSGFHEVVLTKGICSQCRLKQGERLLTDSITTSRLLLESTGLGQFAISVREKQKEQEPMLSRREVFSKIFNKAKSKAATFGYTGEKAIREKLTGNFESKKGKRLSPERKLLRELLTQKGCENATVVGYNPEFPWGDIKIDEKTCSACGTCVALCPTAAILKKLEDGYYSLYFKSSLCTNCSLCKAACPEKAIDFEEDFALGDLLADEAKVVARIRLASCSICGETIRAGKDTRCPTCQKRQVWPMHVKI
jgi:ferredoxin